MKTDKFRDWHEVNFGSGLTRFRGIPGRVHDFRATERKPMDTRVPRPVWMPRKLDKIVSPPDLHTLTRFLWFLIIASDPRRRLSRAHLAALYNQRGKRDRDARPFVLTVVDALNRRRSSHCLLVLPRSRIRHCPASPSSLRACFCFLGR